MVLMHKENFSQIEVPKEMLSDTEQKFLEEGLAVRVQTYEGQPLIVRLPKHMTVRRAVFALLEDCDRGWMGG